MKVETKVGLLFILSVALVAVFAYALGVLNPFAQTHSLTLLYNFAGGIEVGSPVRVMGVKVGKVTSIQFDPHAKAPDGEEAKLKIKIDIDKKAWETVRKDSRFYINLAGVIGEKYLEVSPGSLAEPTFKPGDIVRGEDPPRIDQMISQGYALAGKLLDIVEKNEGTFVDTLSQVNELVTNVNKTLILLEKLSKTKEFSALTKNLVTITDDLIIATSKLRGPEAQKTFELLHELLWRLKGLDEKAIREFLQKEGVRARIF